MPGKRNYPLLFAKGLAMGAADLVPGVSGGTIAFISGIYEELIDSLKSLNPLALRCLFREGPAPFWRHINGTFLLVLVAGILTSVFSLARLVDYSLDRYPLFIWSFFFGLILASIFYVARQQRGWYGRQRLALVLGMAAAVAVAFSPALTLGAALPTVFFAGMLAICAMILPGVSGSFILLLLGMYPVLIDAITGFDVPVLAVFGIGAAIGLVLFANILSWLLHHHHDTTLSVLIGFLAGSLVVVWPWRLEAGADHSRVLLTPGSYESAVGHPQVLGCVAFMGLGLVLVLALEYLGSGLKKGTSD